MAPISVQLGMAMLSVAVLLCLGTQVSRQSLKLSSLDWRTLLVIALGQWVVLPALIYLYLQLNLQDPKEALAFAAIGIAPAGVFTLSTLYLVGVRPAGTLLAGILLLETVGLLLLAGIVELIADAGALPDPAMIDDLQVIARAQVLVLALPLLAGIGLRWYWPAVGALLARLTALVIWLSYLAMIAFALSLKAHFSYQVNVMDAIPVALAMIACSLLAGLAVYGISAWLLRIRGLNLMFASVLIGLQGPVPALRMTVLSNDTWPELAAIAIAYAIVLPALAVIWVLLSRTHRGSLLLPY